MTLIDAPEARFDAGDTRVHVAARSGPAVTVRAEALQASWHAELQLRFAQRDGHTYLADRRHAGPLLVQRPFHPEGGVCHVYPIHPPGGVVGGDHLRVGMLAEPGTHVVSTTPAATKFYRGGGRIARVAQDIALDGAVMEWLPQESIFYRGADARAVTRIRAGRGSKLIAWEVACLGLPARREVFDSGRLHLDLELWMDGCPVFVDRSRISGEGAARTARWGLAGYEAIGILLACPADRRLLEAARAALGTVDAEDAAIACATLVDSVLVCRCLAAQAEQVRAAFVQVWQAIRPAMLGRPAVPPRIWAT